MENIGSISEIEARRILQDNRIERGIDDSRSCIEIAAEKGLIPTAQTVEVVQIDPDIV